MWKEFVIVDWTDVINCRGLAKVRVVSNELYRGQTQKVGGGLGWLVVLRF